MPLEQLPSQYPEKKWDLRFLALAEQVASWSKDPSTKVGAVLVDDQRNVVGLGYNGFPRGVDDDPARYEDRELKYALVVHAELNAILAAGHRARGTTLYVWPAFSFPPICTECCKAVIQAGVRRVVGIHQVVEPSRLARWADSIKRSATMCDEAGITWRAVEP